MNYSGSSHYNLLSIIPQKSFTPSSISSPSSLTRTICTTPRRSRTYLTHTPAIPIQFTTEIPRDTPEKMSSVSITRAPSSKSHSSLRKHQNQTSSFGSGHLTPLSSETARTRSQHTLLKEHPVSTGKTRTSPRTKDRT